ncbi:MAG: helix-turn-helix transcriptional regulator [Clostridia bacterium]|nr:helix-turn-helix transcriptional regulator [Clostridia bacterium]
MFFEEINPFVRIALIGNMSRSNVQDVHTKIKSADCRLFSMISGKGFIIIEDKRYPIVPGMVVLFSAGTEYVWEIEEVKYYAVNFDYTHNFSSITESIHPIHSDVFSEKLIVERPEFEDVEILNKPIIIYDAPNVGNLISEITTEFSMSEEHKDMLLSAFLKAAITSVVRMSQRRPKMKESKAQKLVSDIISYINLNYECSVSNEDIAEKFHFNSAYLNRVFRENTGISMHEFVVGCRIASAKEMLRSQEIAIGEVAEKCGFSSFYHFTKTFKKKTGITPSEYRNYSGGQG